MTVMFYYRVSFSQNQIVSSLNERALDVSNRVAKAVSPSVWNIFQKSSDRFFSEANASAILDAELANSFVTGINVYGNFGHLFMGRFKMPDDTIANYSDLVANSKTYQLSSSSSVPVKKGTMSIGKVEVFYYDENLKNKTNAIYLSEAAQITIPTLLMFISVYFIFRTSRAKKAANKAYKNLKKTQNLLIESEKMASMGALVAGVAHEINTPLGNSLICTTIVLDKTKELQQSINTNTLKASQLNSYMEAVNESLGISEKSLQRVVKLINTFKQVASDHIVEDMREIKVLEYIEELMTTLAPKLKKKNVLYTITCDDTIKITTIPGGLAQVITNLFNNSLLHGFKGLPDGEINIKIAKQADNSIQIEYRDNGKGMTESVQEHIFEPFFTTKRNSGGTGLGMNIVYNVITNKLQGSINITSKVDEGSKFTIRLPETITDTLSPS